MAFIPRDELEGTNIGRRVKLVNDVDVLKGRFTKGHEFTITGSSQRGYDLVDDEGRQLSETPSANFTAVSIAEDYQRIAFSKDRN